MNIPDLETIAPVLAENDSYKALGSALGDRRDGRVYVHDLRIRTAVRVALATRRPLLLRGDPGSGKSSLAPFVARALGWRFYSFTATARMQARDLLWEFDALRRLSEAQIRRPGEMGPHRIDRIEYYIEPKALWWAINPETAERRGLPAQFVLDDADRAKDPGIGPSRGADGSGNGSVVLLIDEIDKADPDVPNNLLESLGSLQFTVQETGFQVKAGVREGADAPLAPLVMITTNDERELPLAFQRRCVTLYLKRHDKQNLIDIADKHFAPAAKQPADAAPPPSASTTPRTVFEFVAGEFERLRGEAKKNGRREPSTAEYLDAVRACLELGVEPGVPSQLWSQIAELTLNKTDPFADTQTSTPGDQTP